MAWHKALHCILGYIESLYKNNKRGRRPFLSSFSFFSSFLSFFSFFSAGHVFVVKVKAPPLRPELPGCICNTVRFSRENDVYGIWYGRKVVFVSSKAYTRSIK